MKSLLLVTTLFSLAYGQLTVGFAEADSTQQERVGSVTITLQKNNTNVGPLTVTITPLTLQQFDAMSFILPADFDDVFPLDGPDPAELSDFNNTVQTVTFPPGSSIESRDVTLEFFDDDLTENLTEFYVLVARLANDSGNNPLDVSNIAFEPRAGFAVIGINDDDDTRLSFEQSSYAVSEDAGPQPTLVNIFKEGGMVSEADLTITVTLSTSSTATEGVDFELASNIMTFTLQQADQMVPVPFNVTDDNIFEGQENIIMLLSIPTNSRALLGAVTSTTISIADNEALVIGFEQTAYTFAEDAGTVEVCTRFIQPGPNQIDPHVIVDLLATTTPDTADANDFQLQDDLATLLIPMDSDRCFTIVITDDNDVEGMEQFTISFVVDFTQPDTSVMDRLARDPSQATIFIQDIDGLNRADGEQANIPIVVNEGNNVTFRCALPGVSIVVQYRLPGNDVFRTTQPSNVIRNGDTDEVTITLVNAQRSDNSLAIHCAGGGSTTDNGIITVYYAPSYTSPGPQTLTEGVNALVNVSLDANPIPDFTWTRDGMPISADNVDQNESFIAFNPPRREDTGTYTIVASNAAGNGNTAFEVIVNYIPVFDSETGNLPCSGFGPINCTIMTDAFGIFQCSANCAIMTGANGILQCSATGSPNPDPVTFISFVSDSRTNNVVFRNDQVMINNAAAGNAGTYHCAAENSVGSVYRIYQLWVGGTPTLNALMFTLNDTHVVIMWSFNDMGVPVSSFSVTIECGSQTFMDDVTVPMTGNQVTSTQTLASYPAGTSCTVTVFTSNLLGPSNTLTSTFMTPTEGTAGFRCDEEATDFLLWPETPAGTTRSLPCPNTTTIINRTCNNSGIWDNVDLSLCIPLSSINTNNITIENYDEAVRAVSGAVRGATTNEQEQTTGNLIIVTEFFATSAALVTNNTIVIREATVQELVRTLEGLQQWNVDVLQTNSSNIVQSFETIVSTFAQQQRNETFVFMTETILFVAELIPQTELAMNGRSFSSSNLTGTTNLTTLSTSATAAAFLPASLFQSISGRVDVGIFFAVYSAGVLFPITNNVQTNLETNLSSTTVVGSPVLSATVGPGLNFVGLVEPVRILLRLNEELENVTRPRCVSWDFTLQEWTTEGCETVLNEGDVATCNCNHLTNFAILVDICSRFQDCQPSGSSETVLEVLTIIGVVLSLIGIVATIITLLLFKKLRERDVTKYRIQLCIALFCMLIVFVSGIDRTSVYGGCVFVSVLIHYFTLVAVMWMGAEALLMFQKLVIVFVRITTKFIIAVSLVCWLVPIIPVIIPLAVDLSGAVSTDLLVRQDTETQRGFCFISDAAVFFSTFLGPIFAILLFNVVIFVLVIRVLVKHTHGRSKGEIRKKTTIRLLISITGVMFLFGLTWLFGALIISGFRISAASTAFQVLFVILNAFQGFFIFLFFCVFNSDARESWLEVFTCGRYKSKLLCPLQAKYASSGATRKKVKTASTDLAISNLRALSLPSTSDFNSSTDNLIEEKYSKIPLTNAAEEAKGKPSMVTSEGSPEVQETDIDKDKKADVKLLEKSEEKDQTLERPRSADSTEHGSPSLWREEGLDLTVRVKRKSTKKTFKHHIESAEVDFWDCDSDGSEEPDDTKT